MFDVNLACQACACRGLHAQPVIETWLSELQGSRVLKQGLFDTLMQRWLMPEATKPQPAQVRQIVEECKIDTTEIANEPFVYRGEYAY